MKPSDVPVVVGGVSAPMWLEPLNEWLALLLAVLSIAYMVMRIYDAWKK